MVIRNLLRRKGRTVLTVIGISIGVAAIVALGALAQGLERGYGAVLKGSRADLVLSQPDAIDIMYSSLDDTVAEEIAAMPEIDSVSGMIQGFLPAEGAPYFFVFGYPEDSFILPRFQIQEGHHLTDPEVREQAGTPILIGTTTSETLEKEVGDSLRLAESVFRVVGIYETGDAFEDSGAVLSLADAQEVLGKPRQVSLVYLRLTDPALQDRLGNRIARRYPDLELSSTDDFADKQMMGDILEGYVWAIAGLAIVIGGVGMTNAQLMAVFERTREIGVLRAVGWSRGRVLRLILLESLAVGLIGGAVGVLLGVGMLFATADALSVFGVQPTEISPGLFLQALVTVLILGVVGGVYPAWRASRLHPLEALRYEGGSSGSDVRRLPVGGMAVQSLWQRTGRTALTLAAIGITVGAVMALDGVLLGTAETMTSMAGASEIMVRQADVSDTSLSAIDQRLSTKIETLPGVRSTSGLVLAALAEPDLGTFMIILGYSPHEFAIQRFNVVEGRPISGSHQIMLGRVMAEATNKAPGDTIDISGSRFRVVGIYESGTGWEEMGGVVSLRDAQTLAGRPNKVTMLSVKLDEPVQAPVIVDLINGQFPEVHAALATEFVEQMPDMEAGDAMLDGISFLAILVGGVGVLNTMLMAVLERTREIGVLRTMGWRRRQVTRLIMQESLILAGLGALAGILLSFALVLALKQAPMIGDAFAVRWSPGIFLRAILVALTLGLVGGLYPSLRASGLQPVEALRYE